MTRSQLDSPTNQIMRHAMRMMVKAKPRSIIMENAFQLAMPRIKPLLDDLQSVLSDAGYTSWTWQFYSYQLGTPQHRRRMFLVATRDPILHPELLDLSDLPSAKDKHLSPLGPHIKDLIGVDPSPDPVVTLLGQTVTQHWYDRHSDEARPLIARYRDRIAKPYMDDSDVRWFERKLARTTDEREIAKLKKEMDKVPYWENCPYVFGGMHMHRPRTLHMDRPAPAIIGAFKYVHPIDDRFLTMREMSNLMGYEQSWQWHKLNPSLIAQGIPVQNARWAVERLQKIISK